MFGNVRVCLIVKRLLLLLLLSITRKIKIRSLQVQAFAPHISVRSSLQSFSLIAISVMQFPTSNFFDGASIASVCNGWMPKPPLVVSSNAISPSSIDDMDMYKARMEELYHGERNIPKDLKLGHPQHFLSGCDWAKTEVRLAHDGQAYSLQEFCDEYGEWAQWNWFQSRRIHPVSMGLAKFVPVGEHVWHEKARHAALLRILTKVNEKIQERHILKKLWQKNAFPPQVLVAFSKFLGTGGCGDGDGGGAFASGETKTTGKKTVHRLKNQKLSLSSATAERTI